MVLTCNQNNRLVMVEEDSVILGEYTYNGLGQRIIKAADGVTTIFHYDFDGNIIGQSDESGNFDKEYLYRSSSRLALVDVSTGEIYYYGNDRLGTPQILTHSTNTVVWEAVYDPFGEADINPNSTVVSNFRFPGQYYDSETGLHYNYHRYYDPNTGRYLKADPSHSIQPREIGITCLLPFILKPPQELNIFTYARNNPIMYSDFFGLQTSDIDFIPSPAYQKAIKDLQAYYWPIFQNIFNEYRDCIKGCDQLRELECVSTFMKPIYVTTCKIGCFLDYTKDYQMTAITYWIRQTLAWEMYQFPNKENYYPGQ
jgi:RHS repeat-associated protein